MSRLTLDDLHRAGISVESVDGKLRLSAPAGRLTLEMRGRITGSRDALLRELDAWTALCDEQTGRERMDKGLPPQEWGQPVAVTCEGCGPVLLWTGCPPLVKSCPWCFRRKAGKPIAKADSARGAA